MWYTPHWMVLVLIGGTYTPFCLIVLNNAWGISMLSVIWGVAGAGILINLAWPATPNWLRVAFYVIVGWLGLVPVLELAASAGMEAVESEVGASALGEAAEAFVTGSIMGVMPLTRVDGQPVGPGRPVPAKERLVRLYRVRAGRERGRERVV